MRRAARRAPAVPAVVGPAIRHSLKESNPRAALQVDFFATHTTAAGVDEESGRDELLLVGVLDADRRRAGQLAGARLAGLTRRRARPVAPCHASNVFERVSERDRKNFQRHTFSRVHPPQGGGKQKSLSRD